MIKYLRWALLFIPMPFLVVIGRVLSPIACLFIVRKPRTDVVKRLGKAVDTIERDDLQDWLSWFRTDDNAADEYWYGWYDQDNTKTQEYYDTHAFYRWYCRMMWYQRNNLYTFNRQYFGLEKGSKWAWQYKAIKPLWFGWNNDINIGYKSHKNIERLMYAGRILGLRKNK